MGDIHEFSYNWELRNFPSLIKRVESEEFEVASYAWRLNCYPKQNRAPWTHVSLFLECVHAAHILQGQGPTVSGTLTVRNHIDPERSVSKEFKTSPSVAIPASGFAMLPLTDATVEAGFLRPDGTMVFTVKMSVSRKRRKTARSVGEDLLPLLGPGPAFSDVTILVGGRSFLAHRNILAARCPYFDTLFTSGVGDRAAREVQLPEADPDAFALLLRVMYGGTLEDGPNRPLLYRAVELADQLQVTDAQALLCDHLLMTCTRATVVEDLLWAAGRDNNPELQERLEDYLLKTLGSLDQEKMEQFMQGNPQLAAKVVLLALAKAS